MDTAKTKVGTGTFLTAAVVASMAIGSIGLVSGSTPEWVALKASVGLLAVGALGWVLATVINSVPEKAAQPAEETGAEASSESDNDESKEDDKGSRVDITLEGGAPASAPRGAPAGAPGEPAASDADTPQAGER